MAAIKKFEEIESWKSARECVVQVYKLSSTGAFAKDFGLRDQMRRAAVSIMSNIAEGFERDGTKEFINFLSVAKASCGETRSQLYVALDQAYVSESDFKIVYEKLCETSRMLNGFIGYLRQSEIRGRKFN